MAEVHHLVLERYVLDAVPHVLDVAHHVIAEEVLHGPGRGARELLVRQHQSPLRLLGVELVTGRRATSLGHQVGGTRLLLLLLLHGVVVNLVMGGVSWPHSWLAIVRG